jgi:hypothetical protein
MAAALLRVALAAAYLAAAALPCARSDAASPRPEMLRAYAAAALHAHGAEPACPDGELRAPCPCGCDEAPAGRLASTPLGAALVPARTLPDLPRAAGARAEPPAARATLGQPADPVPRVG